MGILQVHAWTGYLQHYETLLKELEARVPEDVGSQAEPQDQYDVEALSQFRE